MWPSSSLRKFRTGARVNAQINVQMYNIHFALVSGKWIHASGNWIHVSGKGTSFYNFLEDTILVAVSWSWLQTIFDADFRILDTRILDTRILDTRILDTRILDTRILDTRNDHRKIFSIQYFWWQFLIFMMQNFFGYNFYGLGSWIQFKLIWIHLNQVLWKRYPEFSMHFFGNMYRRMFYRHILA